MIAEPASGCRKIGNLARIANLAPGPCSFSGLPQGKRREKAMAARNLPGPVVCRTSLNAPRNDRARSLGERTAFGQAKCCGSNPDARLAVIFFEKLSGQSSIKIDRASGLTTVG